MPAPPTVHDQLTIHPTATLAHAVHSVLGVMEESTAKRVGVFIGRDDWVDMRDELMKAICEGGYGMAENGNVPGFYEITHAESEPEWRKRFRFMGVQCQRLTFYREEE